MRSFDWTSTREKHLLQSRISNHALRETFHNQAFPGNFIDEITMAGFDLHFGVGF
jgi:hypothetical protein